MRSLLTFPAAGSTLAGTVDGAAGSVGVLMVTGGSQTRIGSHRMYERLASSLAASGHPCFRFDRRGVGDSDGQDPGFRGSADDLAAAVACFRGRAPGMRQVVGFGLCDGATALMLFGGAAGLDGMILVNPWLVEAESGAPPAAAIRRRYREQLLSLNGWRRLLSGSVSFRKLASGLRKAAAPAPSDLGQEALAALEASGLQARLILSRKDATAIAAEEIWRTRHGRAIDYVESDSHTFARRGDLDALGKHVRHALADLTQE